MEREIYWFWLNELPKMTAQKASGLLEHFGDPEAVYRAGEEDYQKAGIHKNLISLLQDKNLHNAQTAYRRAKENDIRYYTPDCRKYPAKLKNIYDRPMVLYAKGAYELREDDICVAIVGTRNATPYGKRVAYDLAYNLARCGIIIVSGMALGIDSAAHEGAMKGGGKTIAVLGTGVNRIYPKVNTELYHEILDHGCVISEYELDLEPQPYTFPPRNRIISGISIATIVVEAGKRSGATITAHAALEQNREVFAVPGNVTSRQSEGTNKLIFNSEAKLIRSYRDVLDELGFAYLHGEEEAYQPKPEEERDDGNGKAEVYVLDKLKKEERVIYEKIRQGINNEDELAQACNMSIASLKTALTMMEIGGVIIKNKGKFFVKG